MTGDPATSRQRNAAARRRLSTVGVALGLALAISCRRPMPVPAPEPAPEVVAPTPAPPPISQWPTTIAAALRAAEAGRYDEADRILVEFSVKHAGTHDGAESDFWRALLKTDPANLGVSAREQISLLDAYIGAGSSTPRYHEVVLLRRMVEAMDSTRSLLTTMRASAEAREKARDEEIKRLNDLVDRTTAELDRIKRRLIPRP